MWVVLSLLVAGLTLTAVGQTSPGATRPLPRHQPRRLAPGVETTIPATVSVGETFSRHDIVELLAVDKNWDWAKDVRFEHHVRALEFTFKPMRFIEVDVPRLDGRLERKLVWYMVFHVRNPNDEPVPFSPLFVLEGEDASPRYADAIVPVAIPAIERRERPPKRLLNTVDITGKIAAHQAGKDNSVWGVVTWTDIDPRIDRFSVLVRGLTNAYRWKDRPDGKRQLFLKTLKLNFWRPGDEFDEHEDEIRLGAPGEVDYEWVYR